MGLAKDISDTEPLLVPIGAACRMLGDGRTKLYELIATGELVSVKDGRVRKITTASITARVNRLLAQGRAADAGTPVKRKPGWPKGKPRGPRKAIAPVAPITDTTIGD